MQYYRLVRNAAAHQSDKSARLDQEYSAVAGYKDLVLGEYGLEAPNPHDKVSFDDHMLYTRVAKYVATDLCRLAPPRTFHDIHAVLTDRSSFSHDPLPVFRYKGYGSKLAKALSGFLKLHYNFDLPPSSQLEQDILRWIGAIPNRKHRRRNGLGLLAQQLAAEPTQID